MSCRCCGNGSDCVGKRLNASFQIRNTSLIVRVFSVLVVAHFWQADENIPDDIHFLVAYLVFKI